MTKKILFLFQSNTSNAGGKGKKKKEIDPTLLKARVLRETRNIPNLIAKLETFMGNLQKLASKGQLISKCSFWCLQIYQKNKKIPCRISALVSKKRSNQRKPPTKYFFSKGHSTTTLTEFCHCLLLNGP